MELKTAIKNLSKDRYVSSMLREELDTIVAALAELQAPRPPEVPIAQVEAKLNEAIALLKGGVASANSKSKTAATSPKTRKTDRSRAAKTLAVEAKAKS